jgi:hypothetical protein
MLIIETVGYHGTSEENVSDILENQFIAVRRDEHWLGQGIYFYDDSQLAEWWIKKKLETYSGVGPAVIKATMRCEKNSFLDLDRNGDLDLFFSKLENLLMSGQIEIDLRLRTDEKSRIRNLCFCIDLLKRCSGLKLIAMTFLKANPSYVRGNILNFEEDYFPLPFAVSYKERQICAASNDIIASKECIYPQRRTNWH